MKVLLVGVGGFGKNHLRAWHELGMGDSLFVADLRDAAYAECAKYNLPRQRFSTDYRDFLGQVDAVDVVVGTDLHFPLCREALLAGKDVFVEKPATGTSNEARQLVDLVRRRNAVLQVGYYYRFHPASQYLREQIRQSHLGDVRYLAGDFMGFKRARTDVGVTHTDGIHFIDLFNWLQDAAPERVFAVTRDHFGRGLEDLSVVLMEYPGGALGRVESGYVQPGRWFDPVVPGAMTTKQVSVAGSQATVQVDYEVNEVRHFDVHHEEVDGVWRAINRGSTHPPVGTAGTIDQLCAELQAFGQAVRTRVEPEANALACGLRLAAIMEAIYTSARERREVAVAAD